jgi:hypothetical protein
MTGGGATHVAGELVIDSELLQLLPLLVLLGHQRAHDPLVLFGSPHLVTTEADLTSGLQSVERSNGGA